jgi:hypothetical protein
MRNNFRDKVSAGVTGPKKFSFSRLLPARLFQYAAAETVQMKNTVR